MKLGIIIQARLTSKRFPRKVLKKINDKTIIEILINNLKKLNKINKIIIAIPNNKNNDPLAKFLIKKKFIIFRGEENNVLKRYYETAKKFNIKNIIRITADCPLIDTDIINELIEHYFKNKCDYASNTNPPTFPHGMDVEIFKYKLLEEAARNAKTNFQREHVTPYIKKIAKQKFNLKNILAGKNIRVTLDWIEDYKVLKKIFKHFKPKISIKLKDIINFYKLNPLVFKINQKYNIRTND